MSIQTKDIYEFEEFRLDFTEKTLRRGGEVVPITPKVFQTLHFFVENAGHLLEKDELMEKLWQGRFVEESNLTFNIKMLRKALGDDATKPRYIETVPKRGYRFVAEVRRVEAAKDEKWRRGTGERGISLTTDAPSSLLPFSSSHKARASGSVVALADWRRDDNEPDESTFVAVPETSNGKTATIELASAGRVAEKRRKYYPYLFAGFMLAAAVFISTAYFNSWFARSGIQTAASLLSAPFISERLSTNGNVDYAVVSPDGKNVIYTNGITGKQSVWLRELASGNNIEIIPPSDNVYGGLALSPDGNAFYFTRRPRNRGEGQTDIYRVSIFGGVPTRIVNDVQAPISVSPDDALISFIRFDFENDDSYSLWIADTSGRSERKLVSRAQPFRIGGPQISPDGKTVAFAVGQSVNGSNEFGLAEVNIESGTEHELTTHKFFNIRSVAWLPDQSGLLISAVQAPNVNFRIWEISAITGEAKQLTKDTENYSALRSDTWCRNGRN